MYRLLTTALLAGLVSTACATNRPIAVVDMGRALKECREGRAAGADLRTLWATDQAQLDQRQAALKRTAEEIQADSARGRPVAEREAAAFKEMQDLKAEYLRLQRELSDQERRRAAPIQARLETELSKLAERRRLGTVKRVSTIVPGVDREVDITTDLIQAMDAATPPGQP
jgi:Skp family chaperone for outer membrane proteins